MIGNFHKKKKNGIFIFVIIISFLYTLFLLSPVLLTLFATPKNHINMMVGHYFEDYYEYLSFIGQGQRGFLLMRNFFDNFDQSVFFVSWWPYWLLGYVTYLLKINIRPTVLYWLGAGIFVFIYFILIFKAIDCLFLKKPNSYKLTAFLLTLFASSFFTISTKKGLSIGYFDYWYSIGLPFNRFSVGTPHHQVTNIVFLLLLIFTVKTIRQKTSLINFLLFLLLSALLLTLSPAQFVLYWLVFCVSVSFYLFLPKITPKKIPSLGMIKNLDNIAEILLFVFPYMVVMIITFSLAYLLKKFYVHSPTMLSVKKWDLSNLYYPPATLFLATSGLLFIFIPAGLVLYFKKISYSRILFFFVSFLSFFLAMVPFPDKRHNILLYLGFHNLRFHTASSYIFLSVAAIEVLGRLLRKAGYLLGVVFLILLFFLPPIYNRWQRGKISIYSIYALQFVPAKIYQGLEILGNVKSEKSVLTSSTSLLGLLVPTVSNKRVYLGRSIFTLRLDEKKDASDRFFRLQMTGEDARELIKEENIGFVLVAYFDADLGLLQKQYPFFKIYYKNSLLTILEPRI